MKVSDARPCCGGSMREGFNCDQAYGTILVSHWVAPERSLLTGVKVKGTMLETRMFRCERCGFLEFCATRD